MKYSRLLVIGDSLSFGSRDEFGSCWSIELAKLALKEDYSIIPLIYATPGYTSFQILKEAPIILEQWRGKVLELFVQFGTNDAKDEINTPLNVFEDNVRVFLSMCFGYRVFFFTIPLPLGFGTDGYTFNIVPRIIKYNEAIKRVCSEKNVGLIDLSFLDSFEDFNDGIHYSNLANKKIAEKVWQKIKEIREWKKI